MFFSGSRNRALLLPKRTASHLNVARLRAHVVDVRPLEPGDDEVHPLSHDAFLYSGEAVEDDRAVTTVHCDTYRAISANMSDNVKPSLRTCETVRQRMRNRHSDNEKRSTKKEVCVCICS